jgi:hypothetical protein
MVKVKRAGRKPVPSLKLNKKKRIQLPKAMGERRPITEAQQIKKLRKLVKEHNQKACLKIPKNASEAQLRELLSQRPIISKRPKELSDAERKARKAAKDKRDAERALQVVNGFSSNARKQNQRTQDIIDKWEKANKIEKKEIKKAGLIQGAGGVLKPKTVTHNYTMTQKNGKNRILLTAIQS